MKIEENKPKQHKVATLTNNKQLKIDKIMSALSKYPEGATPKTIARDTRIDHSYMRTLLPKIEGVEQVGNIRGLYRLVVNSTHNHLFSYNFHNLLLVIYLPNYSKEFIKETLSCEFTNYEFIIGKESKQATLRISTPKINGTDYPINISSISLAFALFKKMVKQHANEDIEINDTIVKSIEFNKDYTNLKLEGINSITLGSLNEQFKVYQKKDKLRLEHKIIRSFNAEEIKKMLGISP